LYIFGFFDAFLSRILHLLTPLHLLMMMVWIGSGDGGVTVAAGQSHCGSGLPSESGLAAAAESLWLMDPTFTHDGRH
jgi:hypothetical protein